MIELTRLPRRRSRFSVSRFLWPLVIAVFAGAIVFWFRGLALRLADVVFACALLGLLAWTVRSYSQHERNPWP